MKNLAVIFMLIHSFFCFGQLNESFSDANFSNNPTWNGTTDNFWVNAPLYLQSKAMGASISFLTTPSEAFDNATWECWVKINYNPSSGNFACIYIASDNSNLEGSNNSYFVKIGDTQDDVSLWLQQGLTKTKIIDGLDKRTDRNPVEVRIKVTRNTQGNFELYSKLASETEYFLEGSTINNAIKKSDFFGLMYVNSGSTGMAYLFDDIVVTGTTPHDSEAPIWLSLSLDLPNKLVLSFSESMNFNNSAYMVNQDIGYPSSQIVSTDRKSIVLSFEKNFERSKVYNLQVTGLKDLAGNSLVETQRSIGISEYIGFNDLIINEVMFENPTNSLEYIEIYNRSEKLLDVSGLVFSTRKADGSLNTGNIIPHETLLMPKGFLALTSYADSIRNYHRCAADASIISVKWSTLNNESSTLVLANAAKDTIYDELTYNVKWHHALLKNPKGVSLERIHPELPTQSSDSWHSASSDTNYGTPGSLNSQYRDIYSNQNNLKTVWLEPEAFSPDNDGVNDICFIKYKTDASGYIANALILNPAGLKVYHLATNLLLSSEGLLIWDGKSDNGNTVNVGIYVLYFEIFNPNNGKRKQQKLPIVVSSR